MANSRLRLGRSGLFFRDRATPSKRKMLFWPDKGFVLSSKGEVLVCLLLVQALMGSNCISHHSYHIVLSHTSRWVGDCLSPVATFNARIVHPPIG